MLQAEAAAAVAGGHIDALVGFLHTPQGRGERAGTAAAAVPERAPMTRSWGEAAARGLWALIRPAVIARLSRAEDLDLREVQWLVEYCGMDPDLSLPVAKGSSAPSGLGAPRRPDSGPTNVPLLCWCAFNGKWDISRYLLLRGASPASAIVPGGVTALHLAAGKP